MELRLDKEVSEDREGMVTSVGGGLSDDKRLSGVEYWGSELEREGGGQKGRC